MRNFCIAHLMLNVYYFLYAVSKMYLIGTSPLLTASLISTLLALMLTGIGLTIFDKNEVFSWDFWTITVTANTLGTMVGLMYA